jgi:uncharacterized protein (TIGR02117 family)
MTNEAIPTRWQRLRRWIKRCFLGLASVLAVWVLINLIGLIPTNNSFLETEDGIEIFVVSNSVHADIVLPLKTSTHDLSEFFPEHHFPSSAGNPSHIAIGWGDTGFFLETPTWSDLKFSTAATALLWTSPTCMHVQLTDVNVYAQSQSVKLSKTQFRQLVYFILASFQVNADGEFIQVKDAHFGQTDAFFQAKGSYHLFNTCNSWVGGGLRSAGVRAPMMSPLPGTPTWYFPN